MNSSAAEVNISALLNLGVRSPTKEFEIKAGEKNDSFDRHLSEQTQKQRRSSAESAPVKETQPDSQAVAASGSVDDASSNSESKASEADETPDAAQTVSNNDQSSGESDRDEEVSQEAATAEDELSEPVSDTLSRESIGVDALISEPLVGEASLVAEEVLVDVPADTSVSLESIVKAVSSVTDSQLPEAESVDDLVETIVPVHNPSATPTVTALVNEAGASPTNGLLRPSGAPLGVVSQSGAVVDSEGLELPEIPLTDPTLTAAKPSEASTLVSTPLSQIAKGHTPPTLTAAVASAVDAVVREVGGAKGEGVSSTREASPLVALSQHGGSRPLSVQQGSAQFTMPPQAKAGQPEWQTAVAERVAVMASQRITSAEIQLDPPELGQLQVRVTLNQEQASVSFASQQAVVREALDQTAHRLRDMFDAEGLNLVDVDVSDQSFHQGRNESNEGGDGFADMGEGDAEPELVKISQGLVDHFV